MNGWELVIMVSDSDITKFNNNDVSKKLTINIDSKDTVLEIPL